MTLSTTKPKALASYLSHAAAHAKLLLCAHDYRQVALNLPSSNQDRPMKGRYSGDFGRFSRWLSTSTLCLS